MSLSRRTLFLVLGFTSTACSNATSPDPRATVVVEPDHLIATRVSAGAVTYIQFTVPVVVHNIGNTPLLFAPPSCGAFALEGRSNSGWNRAWSPICATAALPSVEIAPGETGHFSVRVSASIDGPGAPGWVSPSVDGSYRMVVGLVARGLDGRIPTVSSNEFTLASDR
jgi:hypothetical protein